MLTAALLVVALIAAPALPAHADHVGPHRHFIVTPSGQVAEVAPRACDNSRAQQGFDQFHENVHTGTPNDQAFQQENNPVALRAGRC